VGEKKRRGIGSLHRCAADPRRPGDHPEAGVAVPPFQGSPHLCKDHDTDIAET
jgi:hypothetical protein